MVTELVAFTVNLDKSSQSILQLWKTCMIAELFLT